MTSANKDSTLTGFDSTDRLYSLQKNVIAGVERLEKKYKNLSSLGQRQRLAAIDEAVSLLEGYVRERNRILSGIPKAEEAAVKAVLLEIALGPHSGQTAAPSKHSIQLKNVAQTDSELLHTYVEISKERALAIADGRLGTSKMLRK